MANFAFMLHVLSPRDFLFQQWETAPQRTLFIGLVILLLLISLLAGLIRHAEVASFFRAKKSQVMDPIQVEEIMIGSPPQIIDLRTNEDYRGPQGHIRGTLNIPFKDLTKRLDELEHNEKRPIVLVDYTDALSHKAAQLLSSKGFSWVYVLKGGMKAWHRAKLPVYAPPPRNR